VTLEPSQVADKAAAVGTGLVMCVLALVVLAAAPQSKRNRSLALFFLVFGTCGFILGYLDAFIPDRAWSYDELLVDFSGNFAVPALYLAFIGAAVSTPLVRPFKSRVFRWLAVCILAACLGSAIVIPQAWVAGSGRPNSIGGWNWDQGLLSGQVSNWVFGVTFAVGAIATLDTWRRSPRGSQARAQARAYALAFLVIDAGGVALPSSLAIIGVPGISSNYADIAQSLIILFGLGLLARGLLRNQLFDFDLKVKWALKRGTLVGVILAVFLVATAVAEQFLQGYGFVVGGVAIGLLLFLIRPVERAIDRLADRAMPKTTGSAEYVAYRKLEVYRAAVESEIETHGHDHQEHAVLERLRVKLGISREDADALQREARERVVEASA
jgi:hypothetical protein